MKSTETRTAEPRDTLLQRAGRPYELVCYPLGFPLLLSTNSPAVIDAARESWGCYQQAFDVPPIEYRILVSETDHGPFPETPLVRGQGNLLAMSGNRDNFAVCDPQAGFAWCWIEPQVAAASEWLRYRFLRGMVHTMLCARYLTGIHAACVMKDARGVLLHAVSGTGKSCLSYACAKAGWTFVSDDSSYLVRDAESPIVLGRPQQIRFVESAVNLFPELAGMELFADAKGELAMALNTAGVVELRTAIRTEVGSVVFLKRQPDGPAYFRAIDSTVAFDRLCEELTVLTIPSCEEQKASLRRLLEVRLVELYYSRLDDAVAALGELVKP